jgi:hypothetical protein
MNNLFASWRAAEADVDLAHDLETVELLSRAHDRLAGIPELSIARRLVGVALNHMVEWLDRADQDIEVDGREEATACGSRLAVSPWR